MGFIITYIAFKVVKTKLKKKDIIYDIEININQKKLKLKAMLDTGNMLKDPISGTPVVVVEKQKLYSILPDNLLDNTDKIIGGDGNNILNNIEEKEKYLSKFRMLPFSSVGKQNGLML